MHQGFNGLPVDESTEPSDVIDLAVDDLRLRAMSMRHGRPRADLKRRSHPDVPFRKPMRHGCVVRPLSQSVKSSDLPQLALDRDQPAGGGRCSCCWQDNMLRVQLWARPRLFRPQVQIQTCLLPCYTSLSAVPAREYLSAPSLLVLIAAIDVRALHVPASSTAD